MNYRHAYHAGNFADMMKHGLTLAILRHLQRKPAGFCVLDTHSGCGTYDLGSSEALKTGEWKDGIGRLLAIEETPGPLADYATIVREYGAPARYPGSPAIVASLLRPQDRLICCELHPEEAATLRRSFDEQRQVSVHHRDGYAALKAFLPPRDLKRGLVLIDPPFERGDEFEALARAIVASRTIFPMGIVAAWYPVKHRAPVRAFHDALRSSGLRDIVDCSLTLRPPTDPARLNGCGLIVAGPPWRFEEEASGFLDALLPLLPADAGADWAVTRIVEE